jgi:hypothetical protein
MIDQEIIRPYAEIAVRLTDSKEYVKHFLTHEQIAVSLSGTLVDKEHRPKSIIENVIYRSALRDYITYTAHQKALRLPKVLQLTKQAISDSLEEYIFDVRKESVAKLAADLACETENLDELRKWVKALNHESTEADVMKAAHFVWQIKRKLARMPTTYHTLLHIYGRKQGTGKSTAIRKLLSVLDPAVIYTKIGVFCDDRSTAALERNYVAFVDEIDWANKDSTEYLKNIITAEHVSYRPMRTNDVVTVKNNCTLITAANRHIYEIIIDYSGNRRYTEIATSDFMDWDIINNIDAAKIFKGVDEKIEHGYLPKVLDEVMAEQTGMQMKEDIVEFIEDMHLQELGELKTISLDDLYIAYKQYADENGIKNPLDKRWFSRKLMMRGIKTARKTFMGSPVFMLQVSTKCPVPDIYLKNKHVNKELE